MWEFINEGERVKVKVNSNCVVNDGDIVWCWCVDGEGIVKKLCIDVVGDLLSIKL